MVEKSVALKAIADHPWTALILSADGQLGEVIPFESQVSPEALLQLAGRQAQGTVFRLVPQGNLTERQLDELITSLVQVRGYAWSHTLRPGVNLPGEKFAGRPLWFPRLKLAFKGVAEFLTHWSPFR